MADPTDPTYPDDDIILDLDDDTVTEPTQPEPFPLPPE